MSYLPFFQFYPADWIKDTRCVSLEARGAWIDLLCALWLSKTRGQISWPMVAYDQYLGTIDRDGNMYSAADILEELQRLGVAECVTDCNGIVTLTCRRMIREERIRNQTLERVKRHRNADSNASDTQMKRDILHTADVISGSFLKKEMKNPAPEPAPPGHLLKEDTKPSKLNPKIKEWADQVYAIDPAKFKGLVRWIKAAERTYQPDVIAKTLEHFLPYASQTSDWWPYLDKILDKTEAKANGSETQQQSEHHKQADRDFAKLLFGRK